LTPEFVQKNPDSMDHVERLKDLIVEQVRAEGETVLFQAITRLHMLFSSLTV